jgi:Group II intron, maturase-specific domain
VQSGAFTLMRPVLTALAWVCCAWELAPYMRGWRSYFGFCETPRVLVSLTCWGTLRPRCSARSRIISDLRCVLTEQRSPVYLSQAQHGEPGSDEI